jgi:hypothetical protein
MRRIYMLLATLTITAVLLGGCTSERAGSPGNANSTNSAGAAGGVGGNSNGAGARDGIGPNDTGIGGATNGNSAVKGNSNVEPTGVNKNAGRDAGTNANKP